MANEREQQLDRFGWRINRHGEWSMPAHVFIHKREVAAMDTLSEPLDRVKLHRDPLMVIVGKDFDLKPQQ